MTDDRKKDGGKKDGQETGGGFASPPCFAHEVDPTYMGLPEDGDPQAALDVKRWRKATRERLIAARVALGTEQRAALDARILVQLKSTIGELSGRCIGVYWPFRGEPDLRGFMREVAEADGSCALPVVVEKGAPLVFRRWKKGDALESGVWNIPVPTSEAEAVTPDVVVAPLVGFDNNFYRLGYGGGFYDRTLAGYDVKPFTVGIGYAAIAALPTIYPQWHDVAMDAIVTDEGVRSEAANGRET